MAENQSNMVQFFKGGAKGSCIQFKRSGINFCAFEITETYKEGAQDRCRWDQKIMFKLGFLDISNLSLALALSRTAKPKDNLCTLFHDNKKANAIKNLQVVCGNNKSVGLFITETVNKEDKKKYGIYLSEVEVYGLKMWLEESLNHVTNEEWKRSDG